MDNAVPLPPDFAAMAAKFPNTVKRLLVDGVDPSSVSVHELLRELRLDPSKHLLLGEELEEHIMRIPGALSSVACAALRAAVDDDSNRSVKKDSVDGGAEHEIVLDLGKKLGICRRCTCPVHEADTTDGYAEAVDELTFECIQAKWEESCRQYASEHPADVAAHATMPHQAVAEPSDSNQPDACEAGDDAASPATADAAAPPDAVCV